VTGSEPAADRVAAAAESSTGSTSAAATANEFLVSAPAAVLAPVLAVIRADPAAELVSTGGARGQIDRLLVRLDPAGSLAVAAALEQPSNTSTGAGSGPSGAAEAIVRLAESQIALVEPNIRFDPNSRGAR